jgi:hypothetical protein
MAKVIYKIIQVICSTLIILIANKAIRKYKELVDIKVYKEF